MNKKSIIVTSIIVIMTVYRSVCIAQPGAVDVSFNSIDSGFGSGIGSAEELMQLDNDRVMVCGNFISVNGVNRQKVAILNADGTVDESFDSGVIDGNVYSIAKQEDGKFLIGGNFESVQGLTYSSLARLNSDGSIDTTFPNPDVSGVVRSVDIQSNGGIIISGTFNNVSGETAANIARITTDGQFDDTFLINNGFSGTVFDMKVLDNDKIIAVGEFQMYNGDSAKRVAQLNSDGSLDENFQMGLGFNYHANSISVDPINQSIVLGGLFTEYNDEPAQRIVRIFSDGTRDFGFVPASDFGYEVETVYVQQDGKILVSGDFSENPGVLLRRLARLNNDGSIDMTFNMGEGIYYIARCMLETTDGSILLGNISTYNEIECGGIAKLSTNGELDLEYMPNTGATNSVLAMAKQSDGSILIGGLFTRYNNVVRKRLARINEDGELDLSFEAEFDSDVNAIAVLPDDKILVGGLFDYVNGVNTGHIVRLNADGSIDDTFLSDPGIWPSDFGGVYEIEIQQDGKVLLGGRGLLQT
jgi:uncharacterized delta-60 repeat protein